MNYRIWIIALAALMLQACASSSKAPESVVSEPVAPLYTPQQGLNAKERFREVLRLLEDGQPDIARAELTVFLQQQPDSSIGRDLVRQIDQPSSVYFPEEYQELKLPPGVSLSNLSQQYLGNVFKFHALAKFNGIAEPRRLSAGQTIRIPLTAEAIKAFSAPPPSSTGPPDDVAKMPVVSGDPQPSIPDMPVTPTVTEAAPAPPIDIAAEVEKLHREALNAYRAQKLDAAIGLWEQALALDPEFENARLYRAQAIELKQKLSNLN